GPDLGVDLAVALEKVPALAPIQPALELLAGHGVETERPVHLPQHVIGRGVAELELLAPGGDLALDELAHGVADHPLLFGPLEHGGRVGGSPCVRHPGQGRYRPIGRFGDTLQEKVTRAAKTTTLSSRRVVRENASPGAWGARD